MLVAADAAHEPTPVHLSERPPRPADMLGGVRLNARKSSACSAVNHAERLSLNAHTSIDSRYAEARLPAGFTTYL